jgi:Tfp pilus assembly protein PilX
MKSLTMIALNSQAEQLALIVILILMLVLAWLAYGGKLE